MAKASKKRSKKKSAKQKSVGKRRKASRKGKSAPRKSSRKSVRRTPAKKSPTRKAPAKKAPAEETPPPATDPAWPVLFATLFAFVAGMAAAWIFGDIGTAANAATLSSAAIAEPVRACAVQSALAVESWLTLAQLMPTLR